MTDPRGQSKHVRTVSEAEFEGTVEALNHYRGAFHSTGNAYGCEQARRLRESLPEPAFLWLDLWYGLNHQRIKPGNVARVQSPYDDPEFSEVEVLTVSTYAAFVMSPEDIFWVVWPLLHRMDRLHSEPEFDVTHWVPIQRHMGRPVEDSDAADYAAIRQGRAALTAQSAGGRWHLKVVDRGE